MNLMDSCVCCSDDILFSRSKLTKNHYAHFHVDYADFHRLVVSTRLKNMKVRWDDEIPNIWKK